MRQRQVPQRLNDFEMLNDGAINDEGEIVHFALLAESEPLTVEEAMQNKKWIKAMNEEVNSIEKRIPNMSTEDSGRYCNYN